MSLKIWAIKVGELKPLSRAGLLLFSARCALRVEPWVPSEAKGKWRDGVREATRVSFADPISPAAAQNLYRDLVNLGARASNRLTETDEPLGRCMNYAMSTIGAAVELGAMEMGSPLKKAVTAVAKLSASIPGVLAHAGRTTAPVGEDPVDTACIPMWDAIRADVPIVAESTAKIESSDDPIASLRDCAPLWPGPVPEWVPQQ